MPQVKKLNNKVEIYDYKPHSVHEVNVKPLQC